MFFSKGCITQMTEEKNHKILKNFWLSKNQGGITIFWKIGVCETEINKTE